MNLLPLTIARFAAYNREQLDTATARKVVPGEIVRDDDRFSVPVSVATRLFGVTFVEPEEVRDVGVMGRDLKLGDQLNAAGMRVADPGEKGPGVHRKQGGNRGSGRGGAGGGRGQEDQAQRRGGRRGGREENPDECDEAALRHVR